MLVDVVVVTIKGGNGGNGCVSFRRNAQTSKGGPDGGNGGNGGSVHFQGINDITALSEFRYKKSIRAEDGISGKKNKLFGRNGKDSIIKVPLGTQVTDVDSHEHFEITHESTRILVAKGGKGGKGNDEFKSATNQTPMTAEKGEPGEEKHLKLELRLIADVGFIGLPNVGKSSLLTCLTNAHPKIGDYAFTTIEPNLGVMDGLVLADIPGLIEGASKGKGLGFEFLRHIEKTKLLVHCIDATIENPQTAYETIRREFGQYSTSLLEKPEIILLTKVDLIAADKISILKKMLKAVSKDIYLFSIYDQKFIKNMKSVIRSSVGTL